MRTEMLRVQLSINQDKIVDVYAQRKEGFKGRNVIHTYHAFEVTDLGNEFIGVIRHKYNAGGEELAVKLLRLYKRRQL